MTNNGKEGKMISRNEARALMTNYENSPALLANNSILGILYGKDHLIDILSQEGCVGVRIYFGKEGPSASDDPQLVIIGTDVSGNDMGELILDTGLPCPNHCSSPSTRLKP